MNGPTFYILSLSIQKFSVGASHRGKNLEIGNAQGRSKRRSRAALRAKLVFLRANLADLGANWTVLGRNLAALRADSWLFCCPGRHSRANLELFCSPRCSHSNSQLFAHTTPNSVGAFFVRPFPVPLPASGSPERRPRPKVPLTRKQLYSVAARARRVWMWLLWLKLCLRSGIRLLARFCLVLCSARTGSLPPQVESLGHIASHRLQHVCSVLEAMAASPSLPASRPSSCWTFPLHSRCGAVYWLLPG